MLLKYLLYTIQGLIYSATTAVLVWHPWSYDRMALYRGYYYYYYYYYYNKV